MSQVYQDTRVGRVGSSIPISSGVRYTVQEPAFQQDRLLLYKSLFSSKRYNEKLTVKKAQGLTKSQLFIYQKAYIPKCG